jgi:hypothetical protein
VYGKKRLFKTLRTLRPKEFEKFGVHEFNILTGPRVFFQERNEHEVRVRASELSDGIANLTNGIACTETSDETDEQPNVMAHPVGDYCRMEAGPGRFGRFGNLERGIAGGMVNKSVHRISNGK